MKLQLKQTINIFRNGCSCNKPGIKHYSNLSMTRRPISHTMESTAPYRTFRLSCRNLTVNMVDIKRCDSHCVHPKTCKPQKRIPSRPVRRLEQLEDVEGNKINLWLHVACECVPKKSLSGVCMKEEKITKPESEFRRKIQQKF